MECWLGTVDERTTCKCCFMAFKWTWECPYPYFSCEVYTEDHQRECERLSENLSVQLLGKPFNFSLKRAERTNNTKIQNVNKYVNSCGSRSNFIAPHAHAALAPASGKGSLAQPTSCFWQAHGGATSEECVLGSPILPISYKLRTISCFGFNKRQDIHQKQSNSVPNHSKTHEEPCETGGFSWVQASSKCRPRRLLREAP